MKKRLLFLFVIILSAFIFTLIASGAELNLGVQLDNDVIVRASDNVIYLPSYVDITDVKIVYKQTENAVTLSSKPFASGDSVDLSYYLKRDSESRTTYYELTFIEAGQVIPEDKVYIYKSNNLPAIFIDSSIGKDKLIGNNITDSNTVVSIIDKDGGSYVNQSGTEVRVRGNSTPTYAKKPFQIKFQNKIDLFGMGKAKTWVLLANYLDQSYIRNSIMYRLAKLMGMNASDFQNVEVFIDGEYQGVYLLCEKVNINSNRVDIHELEDDNELLNEGYSDSLISKTETVTSGAFIDENAIIEYKYVKDLVNPEDITGGYLIELDNNNKDNRHNFGSYFITKTDKSENLYVIKSPEYCSKEQVEYIAKIFAEMEEAMASSNGTNSKGKHYTDFIDIDSFAVAYIMAELGRNYDAGGASIYFHKDKDTNGEFSKIVKGPLWDCDNVLGNIHRGDAQNQTTMWAKNRTPWNMLTQHTDFNAKVKEKFEIAYDLIYDMLDKDGFIDEQIREIGYSAKMDRIRWKQSDKDSWPLYADGTKHWFNKGGSKAFPIYTKYTDYVNNTKDNAVGYLCLALEERTNYLVNAWGCVVEKRTRILNEIPPEIDNTEPSQPVVPNAPTTPENPETPPTTQKPDTPKSEVALIPKNIFEAIIDTIYLTVSRIIDISHSSK